MKNWLAVFKAFIYKEYTEVMCSLKGIMFLCIATSNLLQYITLSEVYKLDLNETQLKIQMGAMLIYLVIIVNLFLGHTLVDRFIYEERNNKTIQNMLSAGMSRSAIWFSKILVMIFFCEVVSFLAIGVDFILVKLIFGIWMNFTNISLVMIFVTVPIMCYGILAVISAAYWYFYKLAVFRMVFPIAAYLGIWNVAVKVVNISIPGYLTVIFLIAGIILMLVSIKIVNVIPKERISTQV